MADDIPRVDGRFAAGECHVNCISKAYVANAVSGMVTVIDVDTMSILGNIPVTRSPDGQSGLDLLHTLQVPIQTPVSPDERWVATSPVVPSTIRSPSFALTASDRPSGDQAKSCSVPASNGPASTRP